MKIRRTLHPGRPGTGKYADQYGDSPVCIRYRYDADRNTRLTTVGLIAEERPWKKHSENLKDIQQRSAIADPASANRIEFLQNRLLSVRIEYGEAEPGKPVKAAGGIWNREKRVWEPAYKDAMAPGLQDRVAG